MKLLKSVMLMAAVALGASAAYPCSRIVLRGDSTDVVQVGRTLDWRTPIPTNIYVYPAGMHKQSNASGNMYTWTSKYGTVLAAGYDGGVTEGMNDQGLVINGLFCKTSQYPTVAEDPSRPVMSLAVFVSWMLDQCATTQEVAELMRTHDFSIGGATFDGGTVSMLHWGVTDVTGNTLVIEYAGGKLNMYESPEYQVLTNDPTFPQMQAINDYWKGIGGQNFLPGGVRSSDRFVRADYFVHHVPVKGITSDQGVTELMTIINNVAVPYGYEVPGSPNLSSTQWRSLSDLNRHRYYFQFADQQSSFYIDLNTLLLTPGSPVLKLDTTKRADFTGCMNSHLKVSAPFTPMW
ncbi:MAG: linear amide C-N hydrolase [Muribaculaceae bacterium]|nr:linear amide C-N hydrolase [Muribaculaceae bacterium]